VEETLHEGKRRGGSWLKKLPTVFNCCENTVYSRTRGIVKIFIYSTALLKFYISTTIALAPLPVQEKLTATTSRSSLDHFVLTFLEAALSDESTEEGKTVPSTENNTLETGSSNIELKLTRVVNNKAPGKSRKEFFRFYRYICVCVCVFVS